MACRAVHVAFGSADRSETTELFGTLDAGARWYPVGMAVDTHAAVKTLTDAGADEALAVAVVEVAREAGTEATGELVTRSHFDTALAQLESRLAWRLVTAGIAIAAVVVAALRFLS